jgi:L-iditol 2-dehydrogenase
MKERMQALVLESIGKLTYKTVDTPRPQMGQVLLRVHACGICGSDIPRVFQKGAHTMPLILGHEFAGRVTAVGEGVDKAALGRRAAVFPLMPCMQCDACRRENYAVCSHYNYYGSRCNGGFATYCAVDLWNCVWLDDRVTYEEGAMLEPAAVALHALRRGGIKPGDAVGIAGAGPIGLMLAACAKSMGAKRVALWDIDPQKVAFAKDMGFEAALSGGGDMIERVAAQGGFDLAVEGAGVAQTLAQCLRLAKPMGRVVAMGNPAGDMALGQGEYWEILRKQLCVCGTWNADFSRHGPDDWKDAQCAIADKTIDAGRFITHRLPLSRGGEAFQMIYNKETFCNKVMLAEED